MLALTRHPGERIFITGPDGRRIVLTLVEVHANGRTIIAIDAPLDVRIDREEVARRMEGFNGR